MEFNMEKKFYNKRKIEAYVLGELSIIEKNEIENELQTNKLLQNKIEEIKENQKYFNKKFSYTDFKKDFDTRYKNINDMNNIDIKNRSFSINIRYLLPICATLLLIIFVLPKIITQQNDIINPKKNYTTRIKGENEFKNKTSYLKIFRKKNNKIELLKNLSNIKSGDLIQVSYFSKKNKYGIIISIDGNLNITEHFPKSNSTSTLLKTKQNTILPIAYILDDAPAYEYFLFLSSNKKINKQQILNTIKRQIKTPTFKKSKVLNLPKHIDIYNVNLIKVD